MGMEDGYIRYACDRQERAHSDNEAHIEFMKPGDKRIDEWAVVEYIDRKGADRRLVLCPECAAKQREMAEKYSGDMEDFENEGLW